MGKSLITGIEIGYNAIQAVVLKSNRGSFALVDYRELPIEAGIFSDNSTPSYQKIVKKLKELRKSLPHFSRKVAFMIPDNAVISKVLQIDSQLEGDEIEYAITTAFSQQSTVMAAELSLDFVFLNDEVLEKTTSFQVYAAKKDWLEQQMAIFKSARFEPVVIDIRAHALVQIWQLAARAYHNFNWLLIDIGLEHSSLCIDFADKPPFCKPLFLEGRAAQQGELALFGQKYSYQLVMRLSEQIQRNLSQVASLHGVRVQGIWLSGVDFVTPEFAKQLSADLNLECQILNPLSLLTLSDKMDLMHLSVNGSRFSLAAGIAVRAFTWLNHDG